MSLRISYENQPSDEIERRLAVDLRGTTSHYSQVLFDPIFTPLFTAILGTGGITIGASTITYASIATAIATTALTIGLQMLMAPKPPKPEEAKFPLRQPIPYRIWGVGRTRMAGAMMFWDSTPSNATLGAVQAMAAHRVKSFNRFWLHDDEVTLKPNGFVNGVGSRYKDDKVLILTRLGLPVETAYQPMVNSFPSQWSLNHRGDGQASLMMQAYAEKAAKQNKYFPYGIPQVTAEMDLAFCWDFRDEDQDPDDPDTWKWTQNSALHTAWHLCFNEFGFNLDYRKALLPVIDMWKEEADICDEDIANAGGGTHKRYQCNGFDTAENGPKAGLNAILATCDGHLVARGDGARILTVGKFREDRVVTLTDADIVGHQIQYDVLFDEECNRLVPKFTYPETDYTTTDTDFFEDTSRQLTSGRILTQEGNYQWCHDWRQCRMLGKRDWLRIQEKARGSLNVRLSGINAIYARWVRLETPRRIPALDGALIENRRSVLDLMKGGFSMEFIKHPENIDNWNPAADEGQQPPVPPKPDADEILTPVINLVQTKANGQSVYLRVVILDPQESSLTPIVRYRSADNGSGAPGAWVEQPFPDAVPSGGFVELNTNVVPSGKLLEVQVAFENSRGNRGDYSVTASVTSNIEWTPLLLGSKLVAWWDAEYGLTLSSGQVSAWADRKAGYSAVQASSGSRPAWSATSFNGHAALTLDGTNDYLTCSDAALLAALPVGSSPVELWGVVDQAALPADTSNRIAVWYGNDSLQSLRVLRTVTGGVNRASLNIGTGGGASPVPNTFVDFTGRHVIRGAIGTAAGQMDIDGNPSPQVAAVPSTGSKLLRIGANDVSSAAGAFWNGKIRDVVVTLPLGPDELMAMNTWAAGRVV
jgi:hypothetical protein